MGPGHSDPPTLALKSSEHPLLPAMHSSWSSCRNALHTQSPHIYLCSSQHSKASKEKVREEFDPPLLTASQNQAPRLCVGGNKQQHGLGSKCPGHQWRRCQQCRERDTSQAPSGGQFLRQNHGPLFFIIGEHQLFAFQVLLIVKPLL